MRRARHRVGSSGLAVVLAFRLIGCTSPDVEAEPEPAPEPGPTPTVRVEPRYAPVSDDFCAEAHLHEVPARFDLFVPDVDFPSRYSERPGSVWRVSCRFEARSDDDEFATRGTVDVYTYGDPERALTIYDGAVERGQSSSDTDRTGQVEGWWDNGAYTEERELLIRTFREMSVFLEYHIRHENLYVVVGLSADFSEEEEDESVALAHDIAEELIADAADHARSTLDG